MTVVKHSFILLRVKMCNSVYKSQKNTIQCHWCNLIIVGGMDVVHQCSTNVVFIIVPSGVYSSKFFCLCRVLKPSPLGPQADVLTIEPCRTPAFTIFCLTWIDRILIAGPIINTVPFKLGNYFLQEPHIIKWPSPSRNIHANPVIQVLPDLG